MKIRNQQIYQQTILKKIHYYEISNIKHDKKSIQNFLI